MSTGTRTNWYAAFGFRLIILQVRTSIKPLINKEQLGKFCVKTHQEMSAIYDNWERLVAAVLKKQQLWELFHAHSRSPSILSEASNFSSRSFNSSPPLHDLGFEFSSPASSSRSLKSHPNLVIVSDFNPAFDVKDVCLASAEFLGGGTFGTAYTVTIDNGARIVVKKLKTLTVSELDFKRNMEIVADVRHENVVALRAYYSSKDEGFILYDYYGKGSVYSLLHGQTDENRAHVDWETRLKIAIGAARGIAEIHTHLGGMLTHGNIKASNVFLNLQSFGCVSDLGLTCMIKTTFNPTARCYAPEIKNTQNVSHASDVYSFGILLLELLTRKPSVHVPGGPVPVDLVKLVNSVKSKERAAKVFDADLLKHPSISEQMVKVLEIGVRCVEKSIKRRPKMSEVVKLLEDIFTSNTIIQDSLGKKLVFVEDDNPTFELEDMLRASAEVLGKGTFGTCYLIRLENGITIVLKRLRDGVITFKDFQHGMEVLGRIRHENIVKLLAYYFSRDEKLLVYDYYDQGSIFTLLHGGARHQTPLDWGTRLEIAAGAARGIAYIHRKDGQKVVHGDIKSSNIFLHGRSYGIVSDAGLAQLLSPSRLPGVLSQPYQAPEITVTRRVSQASDVYSFGVVLLELISRRPPWHTTDDGDVVSLVKWVQSEIDEGGIDQVFDVECVGDGNKEAMEQVLQIAMDCISTAPECRPKMPQVVTMLEGIIGVEPSNESILMENAWGQLPFESKLEYLLEDLLPTLTS